MATTATLTLMFWLPWLMQQQNALILFDIASAKESNFTVTFEGIFTNKLGQFKYDLTRWENKL
jgi:hypothetical protein